MNSLQYVIFFIMVTMILAKPMCEEANGKKYRNGQTYVYDNSFVKKCYAKNNGYNTKIVACYIKGMKKRLNIGQTKTYKGMKYSCKRGPGNAVQLDEKSI
ncbi:unnamed protein product [Bursaphelenchus okinawaensis]|uniref:Abnormal cell migration protein 18-like fibronectin type I domain-containing protein n=1 Tax=Bursaphelenchus okinawaensis TaxID=465554 RepID=A0A811LD74_9BILA|nr:unnamed protein product [Bursaphelenchus okinawaensis]CAG9122087.1 unnamed protein product [Bursaphelenchus okinawaensis]